MRSVLCIATLLLAHLAGAQRTYEVRLANLRGGGEDFAPVLKDSTLVFCSIRQESGAIRVVSESTDNPLADLYQMAYPAGMEHRAVAFGTPINSMLHDGPATFSSGGDTIWFTRNLGDPARPMRGKQGRDGMGLFMAVRQGSDWSEPIPFAYNREGHTVAHPSLSADGSRLYFAADLPGGYGGMDLYVVERSGQRWGPPINLGTQVNSAHNDVFPFIHPNGSLYFSSDRPGGYGRLDILHSMPKGSAWSTPRPLPEPINSAHNDLGYTSFATDVSGAFSSDRNGSDALFLFTRTVERFVNCVPQQEDNFCYRFKLPLKQKIGHLPLRYEWDMGDGTNIPQTEARHCYSKPGNYLVRLNIIDTLTGALFFTEASHQLEVQRAEQPFISAPDTIRPDRILTTHAGESHLPALIIEDIRWRLDDGREMKGATIQPRSGKPGPWTLLLDVMGTDRITGELRSTCVSREVMVVPQYRPDEDAAVVAVYQDAIGNTREFEYRSLPFDQFQMTAQEGEDVRFAIELFASKERISLNDPRFAEIRKIHPVVERYDPVRGVYTYSVGEAKTLAEMYDLYVKVKQLHFLDAEVLAMRMEEIADLSALNSIALSELNNTVLRTSNVYFAYKESAVHPSFHAALAEVIDLMVAHRSLQLVIEAHTDGKGSQGYNLKLSEDRAQAVKQHFIAAGIDPDRLVAMGHGKIRPVADNTTEEGRRLNRRVEFRFHMPSQETARTLKD